MAVEPRSLGSIIFVALVIHAILALVVGRYLEIAVGQAVAHTFAVYESMGIVALFDSGVAQELVRGLPPPARTTVVTAASAIPWIAIVFVASFLTRGRVDRY